MVDFRPGDKVTVKDEKFKGQVFTIQSVDFLHVTIDGVRISKFEVELVKE